MPVASVPEFSRRVPLDRLDEGEAPGELVEVIAADAAERAALAQRFGLPALDRLEATVRLGRCAGGRVITVTGTLSADVTQTCVVTLEPFATRVEDTFETRFETGPHAAPPAEVVLAPDEEEPPEPLEGSVLDIGELTAQYLSLALDPHPRAPGVQFEYQDADARQEGAASGPFAALASLAKSHDGG